MTANKLRAARAIIAAEARDAGYSHSDIAQILNLKTKAGRPWKERARAMAAKGARLMRESERKNKCTCPAAVDITFIGHLPGCPEGGR